jgi:hypothetical protein
MVPVTASSVSDSPTSTRSSKYLPSRDIVAKDHFRTIPAAEAIKNPPPVHHQEMLQLKDARGWPVPPSASRFARDLDIGVSSILDLSYCLL